MSNAVCENGMLLAFCRRQFKDCVRVWTECNVSVCKSVVDFNAENSFREQADRVKYFDYTVKYIICCL